jgi:hypothetical protein
MQATCYWMAMRWLGLAAPYLGAVGLISGYGINDADGGAGGNERPPLTSSDGTGAEARYDNSQRTPESATP